MKIVPMFRFNMNIFKTLAVLVCTGTCFYSLSQTQDQNFPTRFWGYPDSVSAIVEDTLANTCYVSTFGRGMNHNEWQLSGVSLGNYQYSDAGNSSNKPNTPAYTKSILSGDTIFLMSSIGELSAYDRKKRIFLWTVLLSDPGTPFLGDIVLYKRLLLVGGNFNDAYGSSLTSIRTRDGQKGGLDFNFDSLGNFFDWGSVNRLLVHGDILYVAGSFLKSKDHVSSYLAAWNLEKNSPLTWDPLLNGEADDLQLTGNTLFVCGNFTNANGLIRRRLAAFDISGDTAVFPVLTPFSVNLNNRVREIEYYKGVLFLSGDFTIANSLSRPFIAAFDLVSSKINSWSPVFPSWTRLQSVRNRLYAYRHESDFFRVYCLQPAKPVAFTVYKTKACHNDKGIVFSTPPLPYATSYLWNYSGNGVLINGNGSNSVTLDISNSATSGTLSVKGLAYCGEAGDSLSLFLNINPLPVISAGPDDTLTCYAPAVTLNGISNTAFAKYNWWGPQLCNTNCPAFTVNLNGQYLLTVTDTVTGCVQKDSVRVGIDTIRPNVTLPPGPFALTCKADTLLLDGSSSTPVTSLNWHRISNSVMYPDPFRVSSPGQYYLVVQNLVNGCKDSSSVMITLDVTQPNVKLVSHTYFFTKPVDTITCKKTSITLAGKTDSMNSFVRWKDALGKILGNPATITSQGIYTLEAVDSINGCVSQLQVSIARDITPPSLTLPAGNLTITCSDSVRVLDGNSLTPGTTLLWTGPGNYSSPDPATIVKPGYYVLSVERFDNGCIRKDSVRVDKIPQVTVNISRDTTVCKGSGVLLKSNVVSASGMYTYTWNTGNTGQQITVQPTSTSVYYVYVSGAGCSGGASVQVNIPPDISDSVHAVQICDGSYTGTITVYPWGGIPPYRFSLDKGLNWLSSPVFSKKPFGSYIVFVRDSLGCTKTDSVNLDGNSSLPKPKFIVSTKNNSGDTIVFVDISNPRPDSVSWIFPQGFSLLNKDRFNPMLTVADTGSYLVTMFAHYGKCSIPLSKTVTFSKADSLLAGPYNNNGIKSILLYPNPNSGQFTVEVEMYKKQNMVLQVVDASGYVHWGNQLNQSDRFLQSINGSNLQNGTYVFRVIAEYDMGYKSFVISR